jgi:hypothetical protein
MNHEDYKTLTTRLYREDQQHQIDRLANKKFRTSGRFRRLARFEAKPGMARYIKEA